MEQTDNSIDVSFDECEVCSFREKSASKKTTLVIFLCIVSFFAGMLIMFMSLFIMLFKQKTEEIRENKSPSPFIYSPPKDRVSNKPIEYSI